MRLETKIHAKVRDQGLLNHNLVLGIAYNLICMPNVVLLKQHIMCLMSFHIEMFFAGARLYLDMPRKGLVMKLSNAFRQMVDEGVSPNCCLLHMHAF